MNDDRDRLIAKTLFENFAFKPKMLNLYVSKLKKCDFQIMQSVIDELGSEYSRRNLEDIAAPPINMILERYRRRAEKKHGIEEDELCFRCHGSGMLLGVETPWGSVTAEDVRLCKKVDCGDRLYSVILICPCPAGDRVNHSHIPKNKREVDADVFGVGPHLETSTNDLISRFMKFNTEKEV